MSASSTEQVIVEPNYNLAIGTSITTAAILAAGNLALGAFFSLLTVLFFVQTGRVRFLFEGNDFEVKVSGGDSDTPEALSDSGENFAVGGANRWKYDSVTNWFFIPSRAFPILVYFNEKQTNAEQGKGQPNFFPVIMNGDQLGNLMTERVGAEGKQ